MDPSQLLVLASTVGAGAYWWFVVVPSERAALGREKRKGELRSYLDGLADDKERGIEKWFYSEWLNKSWFQAAQRKRAEREAESSAEGTAGETPDQGEYRDVQPRFWSLDNPVVFTGALVTGLIVVASLSR